jgi:hypothetical protein
MPTCSCCTAKAKAKYDVDGTLACGRITLFDAGMKAMLANSESISFKNLKEYLLLSLTEEKVVIIYTHLLDYSVVVEKWHDEIDKQYLAIGMMDDILNNLSKIKDLRVISRTSVAIAID